jgi:hypothetical protein
MTDVVAEFAAAADALRAENAALQADADQLAALLTETRPLVTIASSVAWNDAFDVRQQRFAVSGHLAVNGSGIIEGCEFFAPAPERYFPDGGVTVPAGLGNLEIYGDDVTFVNCNLHDLAGPGWWKPSGGRMSGCLLHQHGWQGTDRAQDFGGHGHALYTQGDARLKTVDGSIFIKGFGNGLRLYGSVNALLRHYRFERDIFMGEKTLVGATTAGPSPEDILFDACLWLACNAQFSYTGANNHDFTLTNSHLYEAQLYIPQVFQHATVRGNTFVSSGMLAYLPNGLPQAAEWDDNTYCTDRLKPFAIGTPTGTAYYTLTEWQALTGYDLHSTIRPLPTQPIIHLLPVNQGRHVANLAIYNPGGAATVTVDLTSLPLTGRVFCLRQVRDYAHDRRLYPVGQPAVVAMYGNAALPTGWTGGLVPPLLPNLLPTYGVFEVWN